MTLCARRSLPFPAVSRILFFYPPFAPSSCFTRSLNRLVTAPVCSCFYRFRIPWTYVETVPRRREDFKSGALWFTGEAEGGIDPPRELSFPGERFVLTHTAVASL